VEDPVGASEVGDVDTVWHMPNLGAVPGDKSTRQLPADYPDLVRADADLVFEKFNRASVSTWERPPVVHTVVDEAPDRVGAFEPGYGWVGEDVKIGRGR
jgi:hypothetical protein